MGNHVQMPSYSPSLVLLAASNYLHASLPSLLVFIRSNECETATPSKLKLFVNYRIYLLYKLTQRSFRKSSKLVGKEVQDKIQRGGLELVLISLKPHI